MRRDLGNEGATTMQTYMDGESGHEIVRVPAEAVDGLPSMGPADAHVAHWVDRVEWIADDAEIRRSLKSYGAWEDLADVDSATIRERMLWIALADMKEGVAIEY
jgi:hypothetical protein